MSKLIVFDSKTKSAEITAEDLSQTMELGDGFGNMPAQCPIQPGKLLVQIKDLIRKHTGVEPIQMPIIVKEQYTQVNRTENGDGQKETELKDYLIKRFVTKIEIPIKRNDKYDKGPDAMWPAIVLSYVYTDGLKGIQVAFGENVTVCDNLTCFGKFVFSTHGSTKVSFKQGLELLNYWLENITRVHDEHIITIETLMKKKVVPEIWYNIIGQLFELAVRSNQGESIEAPLNQSQVSQMASRGVEHFNKAADKEIKVTAWELLNWGTQSLKPYSTDMISYIRDTAVLNEFIANFFKVDIDMAIDAVKA